MPSRRQTFRALLAAPELTLMPGAYDALSARMIEAAGFPAMVAGGYAALGSMLAEPDMGQSNMRELADHYARICNAVEIPVYLDMDTGFGGVHNIRRAVRAFEATGAAGIFLTDQVFPNRCGYLPGKTLVPLAEMLGRVYAALDARTDPDFFIAARTDIFSVEGKDAAIERCQRFMEAGVDMAKPQGIDTAEGIAEVVRRVPGPYIATLSQAAGANSLGFGRLTEVGASAVTFPSIALFAAAQAVTSVLRSLKDANSLDEVQGGLLPLPDYYALTGLQTLAQREEGYVLRAEAALRKPL